jgi:hypothetical protein
MLETFTIETFQARLGELFNVVIHEKLQMQAKLTSVYPWGDEDAKNRPRQPFSILLHAAPEAVFPQRIYRLENENMEPFEAFLSPIGPDEYGMRYEAVFT